MELLGHMITLKFDFQELPNSVPQKLPHFKFPAAMDKRSHCSTPLPKLVLVQVFGDSHPSGVVSRGFDLHSRWLVLVASPWLFTPALPGCKRFPLTAPSSFIQPGP